MAGDCVGVWLQLRSVRGVSFFMGDTGCSPLYVGGVCVVFGAWGNGLSPALALLYCVAGLALTGVLSKLLV